MAGRPKFRNQRFQMIANTLVSQKLNVILILDLLHVVEKIWKAAHVFYPEGISVAAYFHRNRDRKCYNDYLRKACQLPAALSRAPART